MKEMTSLWKWSIAIGEDIQQYTNLQKIVEFLLRNAW